MHVSDQLWIYKRVYYYRRFAFLFVEINEAMDDDSSSFDF